MGSLTLVVRAVLYAAVSARQANFEQILDIVETFSDEVSTLVIQSYYLVLTRLRRPDTGYSYVAIQADPDEDCILREPVHASR